MVEFHPNFSALHPHTLTTCPAKVLLKRSRQSICLGMIRRCETMTRAMPSRREETSSEKTAPRSVIITEELHA
ncbi:hypothetical protein TNCV_458161 [Trichonephila clavipes]|nr:hypothetical protein TNCV_458161 [Trichonephila clavipes]